MVDFIPPQSTQQHDSTQYTPTPYKKKQNITKKLFCFLCVIEQCIYKDESAVWMQWVFYFRTLEIALDKYPEVLSGVELFLPEQAFVSNLADKRCCVDVKTIKIAELSPHCKIEIKQSQHLMVNINIDKVGPTGSLVFLTTWRRCHHTSYSKMSETLHMILYDIIFIHI